MKKKENKEKKDVKDITQKKVESSREPNKQVLIFTGIFLVTLGTFFLIFFSAYIGINYSPLIRDYVADNLPDEEIPTGGEGKRYVITQEEKDVVEIIEEASHSVVSIAISQLTLSQEEGLIDKSQSIGSGFVVDSSGLIVTNQHVVSDTTADYTVITEDGDEYTVVEILRDDFNDIAIVKIALAEGEELSPLTLGDSDSLLVGQKVIAIGTPLGKYAGSATTGIISGLNRSVTASSGWFGSTAKTYEDVIQTDAAVNPGNSGGPLINSLGEVIGINFATTSGADNISFAIPINKVKTRLEEYRTYGKFIRPYLGVSYQMISEYEALYYTDVVPGALVLRVDPASPAFEAGIERGDIIVEFEEEKVNRSLAEIIQEYAVGEEVSVTIVRDGKEQSITVVLGEQN
ncbi:MAG: Trypsin-like serine protease with C-terminal PDZ domain [candidate division WS6 bacterium 36_33]|uniref:Trypsin-like serine protease with C-terminal PDZ domain n=1 Tax=candidate division WS6 bacterium 36_33 TaxID=1641388 RepID=A0A101GZM1_9BACT|nr:MAG: Trypsin-like serine protease with C-terminal PDZ domain [candidate division WS6 bacterium 36_33]